MKYKYAVFTATGKRKGTNRPGRCVDPDSWCTGPDPVRHDKYYAYLKHRAQARYRKEAYSLTWDDWEQLWPDDLWSQRGRSAHNLCLHQRDLDAGWHRNNVEVTTRKQQLQRKRTREIGNV